jgi:hypothetical protein
MVAALVSTADQRPAPGQPAKQVSSSKLASAKNAPPAKVTLTKGWATFGLALPAGVASKGLKVGGLATQTDVKTRWPDGSIRFAVLTAQVPRAGIYPVDSAIASAGTMKPRVPAASVRLAIGSDTYQADLSQRASTDLWLSGPLVFEWRCVVAPAGPGGKPHPFLRVLFDVRAYKDGAGRVDVAVENSLDFKGATALTYNVAVSVNGKKLFHKDKVYHPYLTRWRKVFGVGLTPSEVRPDFQPFFRARALPRYLALVANRVARPEGPAFQILQKGHLAADMRGHGGRPELAPYPDWTARYLVHKNPTQGRYVLAHGDLAGSWPVHIQEPEKGKYKGLGKSRLVSIDERPDFWLDGRADVGGRPQGDLTALGPLVPDNAHVPSLAYVPYLLTGDRYYADEMAYWANYVLLRTFQDGYSKARGGSKGLLGSNETRGIAWGLRNLVDAAAYLSDAAPARAYLADKVDNNLKWADRYAETHVTPLGTYFEGQAPETAGTKVWSVPRPWQNNYVAWSLDHAAEQGFKGGLKLCDRLARFQLKLFTSPDFKRDYAGAYTLVIGRKLDKGRVEYWKTLRQAFEATYGKPPGKPTPFAGYYGVDARLMLMIARRNGWAGAKEAYRYLFPKIGVVPYKDRRPDLADRAGWAIAFEDER